jgi:hypothetical protein
VSAQQPTGETNERLRKHRVGYFRLRTRRERDWRRGRWALGPTASPAKPSAGLAPAKPISQADLQGILEKLAADQREKLDWKVSIVDLMKLLKLDSSLDERKKLAQELGYTGALSGSSEMNTWLHKQVMTKIAESGGRVPESLKT